MQSFREAAQPNRAPTPKEDAAIRDVRDLAVEWDANRLPLRSVRELSTARQRYLATRFTPPTDPTFQPLMRLLDALIEEDASMGRTILTKHGPITPELMAETGAIIVRDEGRGLVIFPVRYPGGDRSRAEFRTTTERHPTYGSFGVGTKAQPAEREPEPWEE